MIRPALIVVIVVLAVMVTGLFELKYEVRELDQEKGRLLAQIEDEREALRVLQAEWSYLNQPERIEALATQHLRLATPTARQIAPIGAIPMRPAADELAQVADAEKAE